jgi:plasmid maintenance system antidote protein VapI
MSDLSQTLRNAIAASGKSANQLASESRVPQTTVSRFIRGNEITLGRAGKIARVLGLRLLPAGSKR